MKLSISIMGHPSRESFFKHLTDNLGNVPFALDHNNAGEWENCKAAWRLHDPSAQWHVVIQDDAIICKDFMARALSVIKKAKQILDVEDYVCNFYFGARKSARKTAAKAMVRGYWVNTQPKWGVAICMQTKFIEDMIKFGDKLTDPAFGTRDDIRIAKFIGHKNIPVYFPMPSIINHRAGQSLVGDPGTNRQAYKFIDDI